MLTVKQIIAVKEREKSMNEFCCEKDINPEEVTVTVTYHADGTKTVGNTSPEGKT